MKQLSGTGVALAFGMMLMFWRVMPIAAMSVRLPSVKVSFLSEACVASFTTYNTGRRMRMIFVYLLFPIPVVRCIYCTSYYSFDDSISAIGIL